MKKMIRIVSICIIIVLIAGFIFFLEGLNKPNFKAKNYEGSIYSHSGDIGLDYQDILDNEVIRPNDVIEINALDYEEFIDVDFGEDVTTETFEGITGLLIPETGNLSYLVDVDNEGYYNIKIDYYTISGRSSSIQRGLLINDEYQFQELSAITLSRIWVDEFKVEDKRVEGRHDKKPASVEKEIWNTEILSDVYGYYDEPYLIYFKKGINKLTLVGVSEPVVISKITLFQAEEIVDYKTYNKLNNESGLKEKKLNDVACKIQAENSFEHNQATLNPIATYNSYKVEPYAKFLTRYNAIGGDNWSIAGDWISWEIDVEEEGLYVLTFKSLQNYHRGLQANRRLYINGKVPFKECLDISFNYKSDWQNVTIGGDEPYLFHLNKGKNIIKLQNVIGSYASPARVINQVIADLNWIYRKVIMRTGVNPYQYQDYQLYASIDGLKDTIDKCINNLEYSLEEVIRIAGERSSLISSIETTLDQLKEFKKSERKIQIGLASLENNITALGTWVMTVSSQPLAIDYILVHGKDYKLPKPSINFFQRLAHEFVLLIGSYTADTSLKSSVEVDGETITVWIMTGRDQSQLLRSLIDESFTIQKNINVDLKLVSSSVLLKAILSGNGPDVAIGVGSNIPVNWGIRNAVVDLAKFSDFDEYKNKFYPSALVPFSYKDSCYALPDTQDFQLQFVRNDIFKEIGLVDDEGKIKVPTNWNEVLDLLPELQRQYLDYYLPNSRGALSPLLYGMIVQYGGSLYLNDGKKIGLMEAKCQQAFFDFVNFYKNYGFDVDASFVNRFRTGEMPIGVSSLTTYNTLSVSAPEIKGNWSFSLLPGYNIDGVNNYATAASSNGTIITSSTKHLNASWEFVKWWLDSPAQSAYARGMESILGSAARYPTANIEAFKILPWSAREYKIIEEQRKYAVGIPTVPGDYIVGRYIDNAFRNILNEGTKPGDALFNYCLKIDAELSRKQKELGLVDEK